MSGGDLSRQLKISRTAVWKHVRRLEEEGYEIYSTPRLGYRLVSSPDRLYSREICQGLTTKIFGQNIVYFELVDSTNVTARRLAEEGAPEGTVVIADAQTGGKGRLGRDWYSPAGNGVWMSVILRPRLEPAFAAQLTMLAALAGAETMHSLTNLQVGIKWPNDILVGDKKVAGILAEMKGQLDAIDFLVVGMGINANLSEEDFSKNHLDEATSLKVATGRQISRVQLVRELLTRMEEWYERFSCEGFDPVRQAWLKLNVTLGKQVIVSSPAGVFQGVARRLADDGALIVEDESGREVRFYTGDVSIRTVDSHPCHQGGTTEDENIATEKRCRKFPRRSVGDESKERR